MRCFPLFFDTVSASIPLGANAILEERQMCLRTFLFSYLVVHVLMACNADESIARRDDVRRRRFVPVIDALHTLGGGKLHQEIVVEEDSTFFVRTRVGKICWTFAGDVGHTIDGHLPVLMRSRWFADAKSNESSVVPKLLTINGKSKASSGAVHGVSFSVTAAETTEADELPSSKAMEHELQRMVHDLQKAAIPKPQSSKK